MSKKHKIPDFYEYLLEGLMDYYHERPPYEDNNDHRLPGWNLGRQIVAQYLVEMLFKIYLEKHSDKTSPSTHNLALLFAMLPIKHRRAIEKRYTLLLNSEFEWAWDVCESVKSFLKHMGKNPIAKTRYPWQQGSDTFFFANSYRPLISAIYIELFDYPFKEDSMKKRYDTEFRSLKESLKDHITK